MSPHALPAESPLSRRSSVVSKFAVTRNAFLPAETPLQTLPNAYYEPWERIAKNMPALVENGIRQAVMQLPMLSTDQLVSEPEWQRAYVMLSFMANAYIWGGDKPEQTLPPQVTVPFLTVAAHFELPPVLTYAGANLWNFTCCGDDFSDIDSLSTLITFTGTESESWFFLISVAMEAKAAGIIDIMMDALDAVTRRDYQTIIDALQKLSNCIKSVGTLLERMYEKCDPMTFYHHIRPYLAGSKGMENAGLPQGVFYDEGDGKGEWRQFRGGSNGQSSLIQFFDIILGVDHNSHGSTGQKSYHDEVREYMPGGHRRFLVHIARLGSIRELAMNAPVTEEQKRLRIAYSSATEELGFFRNKHIQIVTRYIILPSKQPWHGTRQNLASISSAGGGEDQLTGTGGTMLVPFLKHARDETMIAGKLKQREF